MLTQLTVCAYIVLESPKPIFPVQSPGVVGYFHISFHAKKSFYEAFAQLLLVLCTWDGLGWAEDDIW
jgi:hypothetical protein